MSRHHHQPKAQLTDMINLSSTQESIYLVIFKVCRNSNNNYEKDRKTKKSTTNRTPTMQLCVLNTVHYYFYYSVVG